MSLSLVLSITLALQAAPVESAAQGAASVRAQADRSAREGEALYREGRFEEALRKFEEAIQAGASGGSLFYQAGQCMKSVRRDQAASRDLMNRAVPLLEAEVAVPGLRDPGPFFYLGSIYLEEIADVARGQETVRWAADLADKGTFDHLKEGEGLYEVARIYQLAGQPAKSIAWLEKAVPPLESDKPAPTTMLRLSYKRLAEHYLQQSDFEKSARWFEPLVAIDPANEQQRMTAAVVMVRAGWLDRAVPILSGFTSDAMATEANYLRRTVVKCLELGPSTDAEVLKLDDAALVEAITKAGIAVRDARKEEDSVPPGETPGYVIPPEPVSEEGRKVPQVTMKDPNNPTLQEYYARLGIKLPVETPEPPPSPERLAAEKEFFGLLLEYVRRGRPMREMALSAGVATIIFR